LFCRSARSRLAACTQRWGAGIQGLTCLAEDRGNS
jgi:hypothetical protein